jgi:hypothetical protein
MATRPARLLPVCPASPAGDQEPRPRLARQHLGTAGLWPRIAISLNQTFTY